MARPESLNDIELKDEEFGIIQVGNIAGQAALLKAYAVFMEACEKAGAIVDTAYYATRFRRPPTEAEKLAQLEQAQRSWDEGQKLYGHLRDIGDVEHEYQRGMAQRWAEGEGLSFPPEHDPILKPLDEVLDDIEEAVRA